MKPYNPEKSDPVPPAGRVVMDSGPAFGVPERRTL